MLLVSTFSLSSYAKSTNTKESSTASDIMEVHYINVDQGDATLIKCGNTSILIDAGDNNKGTALWQYLIKQNIKNLSALILTHPDSDHIGGADVIITKFNVEKVFMSPFTKDNRTYEDVINALKYKNIKWETPKTGSSYILGNISIDILGPVKTYSDPNNSSIALLITHGNNKFLFTGDALEEAESDIIKSKADISCTVYKAGHHGSRTSSSNKFLKAASPEYAVISCEEGNSYGHPHSEVLNRFRSMGVKVFRTDEQGTIVVESDGESLKFNVPPSESWKAGEPIGNTSSKTVKNELAGGSITATATTKAQSAAANYVLNKNTKKFHYPSCSSADDIKPKNRQDVNKSREEIIASGYVPCKRCNP